MEVCFADFCPEGLLKYLRYKHVLMEGKENAEFLWKPPEDFVLAFASTLSVEPSPRNGLSLERLLLLADFSQGVICSESFTFSVPSLCLYSSKPVSWRFTAPVLLVWATWSNSCMCFSYGIDSNIGVKRKNIIQPISWNAYIYCVWAANDSIMDFGR